MHDELVKSKEQITQSKEELEWMKKAQEKEVIAKTKAFDNREWLERAISFPCGEIPNIIIEMFVEEKVVHLGKIVANLKKGNEEL